MALVHPSLNVLPLGRGREDVWKPGLTACGINGRFRSSIDCGELRFLVNSGKALEDTRVGVLKYNEEPTRLSEAKDRRRGGWHFRQRRAAVRDPRGLLDPWCEGRSGGRRGWTFEWRAGLPRTGAGPQSDGRGAGGLKLG